MRSTVHESALGTGVEAPDAADAVWWTFPALPVHARLARNWLAAWLDAEGPGKDEQVHGALVAFSELVTNAVLHAAGPVTVHTRLAGRRLLCEVTDRCAEMPRLLEDSDTDTRHQGLSLIERLTAFWWVHAAPGGGKTIGFAVDLDQG